MWSFVALPLCLGIALASGALYFQELLPELLGVALEHIASASRFGVSGSVAGLAVIILITLLLLVLLKIFYLPPNCRIIQIFNGFLRL